MRTGKQPDWVCPSTDCRNKNFGWRESCNRCQVASLPRQALQCFLICLLPLLQRSCLPTFVTFCEVHVHVRLQRSVKVSCSNMAAQQILCDAGGASHCLADF